MCAISACVRLACRMGRSLPLLRLIAHRQAGNVLFYLPGHRLEFQVKPC